MFRKEYIASPGVSIAQVVAAVAIVSTRKTSAELTPSK